MLKEKLEVELMQDKFLSDLQKKVNEFSRKHDVQFRSFSHLVVPDEMGNSEVVHYAHIQYLAPHALNKRTSQAEATTAPEKEESSPTATTGAQDKDGEWETTGDVVDMEESPITLKWRANDKTYEIDLSKWKKYGEGEQSTYYGFIGKRNSKILKLRGGWVIMQKQNGHD